MALDAERIQRNIRKLRKMLKRPSKRPSPEEIHDLRTHIRRFETTAEVLALSGKHKEKSLLRRLKRIRKQAGKVRDMDVHTAHLSSVHVDAERDCLIQVLEHLGAQRYRKARDLKATIDKVGRAVRRSLKRTSRRLERILGEGEKEQSSGQRTARTSVASSALEYSEELTTPQSLNRRNLHPYRLKVKELRDVLRMAANPTNDDFVNKLGGVKDAIGEWHDWEELLAIAAELLDHGPRCGLLRDLRTIADEKFERALADSQEMRKKYLKQNARRPRSKNRHGPTRPVLRASAAVAA